MTDEQMNSETIKKDGDDMKLVSRKFKGFLVSSRGKSCLKKKGKKVSWEFT